MDLAQLVSCLAKRYGPVELVPEGGFTKLRIGDLSLTFTEAERLCKGQTTLEQLNPAPS